ncbi:cell surface glycoprotein CD200 receptor 1-like isoform X1 [Acinonyx jubatus]|uniref:Cell surface glycoprotein CD200 receptor 1-like isoform X1 n=1 Tax=Acinonyx jubatus TaxID=32536 RepID=A0ABM3PYS7_ACIJB|nr:cell surface glycoprotein CD200 receptor 1-like isoform X1 [Acinonyx jubatus]
MPCTLGTFGLWLLLILTVSLVAEMRTLVTPSNGLRPKMSKDNDSAASTNSSLMDRQQRSFILPVEANTSLSKPVDTKAVLSCPPITQKAVLVTIRWEIILRDKPSCTRAYRRDTNETRAINCSDETISWDSRPDRNPALQINPVAITHDGYYRCEVVTTHGHFYHGYHLKVLVAPEVTLFQLENETIVCRAAAGKPAAQISWTPGGDCHTVEEPLGNDTVTVQSSCRWEDHRVSNVSCSVYHLTGNRSLSIERNSGVQSAVYVKTVYIILPVLIILVIVGSICLWKIGVCRKCKLKKREANSVAEEDEMQPYASYTEKNNPLYDTVSQVKRSEVLQNEADGLCLHTSYITGI